MAVYEVGYGHHARMCLFSREMLFKIGETCLNYLSLPENKNKTSYEIKIAKKIVDFRFAHMFDTADIFRVSLTIDSLTAINAKSFSEEDPFDRVRWFITL